MKQTITSEKLYEGIGYMDDKWLKLLDVTDETKASAKSKKNRRFVGYELKKQAFESGELSGYKSYHFPEQYLEKNYFGEKYVCRYSQN